MKDDLERVLNQLVCGNWLLLIKAQRAIPGDRTVAYRRLLLKGDHPTNSLSVRSRSFARIDLAMAVS
jgi:hypothetical protein